MEIKIGISEEELCAIVATHLADKGILKEGMVYSNCVDYGRFNDFLGNLGDDELEDHVYFYFKDTNDA